MIISTNVEDQISSFKEELIKDCKNSRKINNTDNNFIVKSNLNKKVYKIFNDVCEKRLNKYTLVDNDNELWCYYTDQEFNLTNWHNHINTTTINGVLYLKMPKIHHGIDFKLENKIINLKPKEGDLLIFPNFLDHYPHPSLHETRISINLELRCKELSQQIFKENDA